MNLIDAWHSIKNKSNTNEDAMGISNFMLTYSIQCPTVFDALLDIINSSLLTKVFPPQCKSSVITPIPKIKTPMVTSDFRPISVQTNLS